MVKVKQLYVTITQDGDTYLIGSDVYPAFSKLLDRIDESYNEHNNEDIYYDEFNNLVEHFNVQRLEGKRHYIVLLEDVEDE